MLHPAWIEREAPLPRCPLARCRRSATCHHSTDDDPCRRRHQTKDEMRTELARYLDKLSAEATARDPEGRNFAPEGSPEQLRRLKLLYDLLRARDEAHCAAKMAEIAARRKAQKKQRPAGAGSA